MTYFIGVDPAQRHTGICIRQNTRAAFYEIKTGDLDILQSCLMIRTEFQSLISQLPTDTIFCVERQIVAGASYSPLQFHVYQVVFEEVFHHSGLDARIVAPSPVQLKQYMSRIHKVDTRSKQGIVDSYHKHHGKLGRKKSSHKVEAYYLTKLGEACLNGLWYYKYDEKRSKTLPWDPIQGVKPPSKPKKPRLLKGRSK